MNIVGKCARTITAIRDGVFLLRLADLMASKYGTYLPVKLTWNLGIQSELKFWDDYLRTNGLEWPDDYRNRLDPNFPLQPRPAALLSPVGKKFHLLDVGAGPLTYVGKQFLPGAELQITAVDPLADQYNKLLHRYKIHPIVRTQRAEAETLTTRLSPNTFDLCVARNCLDHAFNPEQAILEMLELVKRGCYLLLEHYPNEAENEHYRGLHQWNFSMSSSSEFIIRSRSQTTNMTQKLASRCTISCEMLREGGEDWLITRILKS